MEKQKLLEFLACPVCQAPLTEFSACAACGEAFSEDDGTPNFMPSRGTRTVSFSYTPQRSTVDDATLRSFFKFPPRHGEDKALPFRMDAAFGDLIETLPQGSTMLEIGCGGGQVRQWTEDKGLQYVGTDISKIRIPELLQAHGGPDLLSDAHFLAFRDERFDVVYASAVMEHLACPALAVQEVSRILKPGGVFMGSGSFIEPWHDDSFFHLSPLGVMETLTQAGFEIQYIWPGWDGFTALFAMLGTPTRPVRFVGGLLNTYYRGARGARDMLKKMTGRAIEQPIFDDAKVAGAMDWIARKPAG